MTSKCTQKCRNQINLQLQALKSQLSITRRQQNSDKWCTITGTIKLKWDRKDSSKHGTQISDKTLVSELSANTFLTDIRFMINQSNFSFSRETKMWMKDSFTVSCHGCVIMEYWTANPLSETFLVWMASNICRVYHNTMQPMNPMIPRVITWILIV